MATKINTLRLINWKSFANAELNIDPMTFIIGTNASGKSNILDALEFLKRIVSGVQIKDAIPEVRGGEDWIIRKGYSDCSLTVIIDAGDYDYCYAISIGNGGGVFTILSERLQRRWRTSEWRDLFYTNPEGSSTSPGIDTRFITGKRGSPRRIDLSRSSAVIAQVELLPVLKEIRDGAKTVTETIKRIFILNPQPYLMRNFSKLTDQLAPDGSNIAGLLAGMQEPLKSELEEKLTQYVRPLPERDIDKVWAEKVGRYGTDAMLYCDEAWSKGEEPLHLDARGMSDGTLRFIAIVTAILTLEENSLLVIEEIDNGLHPSRAEELVRILKELAAPRLIDVLCTTHNPVLLDVLGNSMIPFISFVKRDATGCSRIELVEDIPNLAKLMAGNSLGGLMINDLM